MKLKLISLGNYMPCCCRNKTH